MIQRVRAVAVLVLFGVAGCAPLNMVKSGATAQESDFDKSECTDEAIRTASAMGLNTEIGFALQKRITLKDCLTKRGYAEKGSTASPQTNKQPASPSPSVAAVQPTDKEPGLIKMFTGTGLMTTRPFTAPDKWEIQWTAQGGSFAIFLYDAEGKILAVAANQTGPGSGSSYQPKGGEYVLQISPMGPWTVKVVKVEN